MQGYPLQKGSIPLHEGTAYTLQVISSDSIGNRMHASAIKDLHYKWYLKILSKLHEPCASVICTFFYFFYTSSVNR